MRTSGRRSTPGSEARRRRSASPASRSSSRDGRRSPRRPRHVRRRYEREDNLRARKSVYVDAAGPDAGDVAVEAVREVEPRRILEVGCGEGELAERLAAELRGRLVAFDQSSRMVELARARGVDARVGNVEEFPLADGTFDVPVAAWMLYHVTNLDPPSATSRACSVREDVSPP